MDSKNDAILQIYCTIYSLKLPTDSQEQSGAVEACWAHNPEVRGSKPRSANTFLILLSSYF